MHTKFSAHHLGAPHEGRNENIENPRRATTINTTTTTNNNNIMYMYVFIYIYIHM